MKMEFKLEYSMFMNDSDQQCCLKIQTMIRCVQSYQMLFVFHFEAIIAA